MRQNDTERLIEKYDGDALKGANDWKSLYELDFVSSKTEERLHAWAATMSDANIMDILVRDAIAYLGADGAEKWGRALMKVLGRKLFVQDGWETLGDEITLIALAADDVRLAACLVALAEEEG